MKRADLERAPQPNQEYGDTLRRHPLRLLQRLQQRGRAGSTARSRVARAVPSPRPAEHLRGAISCNLVQSRVISPRRAELFSRRCAREQRLFTHLAVELCSPSQSTFPSRGVESTSGRSPPPPSPAAGRCSTERAAPGRRNRRLSHQAEARRRQRGQQLRPSRRRWRGGRGGGAAGRATARRRARLTEEHVRL